MKRYALGLDYGTNSCRSVIVDLSNGAELATHVFNYPTGEAGILLDSRDPNVARQDPQDYLSGTVAVVKAALRKAKKAASRFRAADIVGIGVDTTGSTPMPVDRDGTPLPFLPEFRKNLDAMAWLWKDHTRHAEAAEITETARKIRPQYLAKCGGTYSSEWFWSKILHCKRAAPEVFDAAHSFVEHCDYMPALLAGDTPPGQDRARRLRRRAQGHVLRRVGRPARTRSSSQHSTRRSANLRDRLFDRAVPADQLAGGCARNGPRSSGSSRASPSPSARSTPTWAPSARGSRKGRWSRSSARAPAT